MIKSIEKIFGKHPLLIALGIVLIAFLFSRLPFFIWMPVPAFPPDTFDYYNKVRELISGTFKSFGFFPPGNILFLYCMELLCSKTSGILLVQHIVSLFSCTAIVLAMWKYYGKLAIAAAACLAIYAMDSATIYYDNTFLTESLYRNSLMLITAMLIIIINEKKIKYWILFSILMIAPAIIRANGLYLCFLPLLLLVFLVANKYGYKYYIALVAPFLLLNLLWSVFNYSTEGIFAPGNPLRVSYSLQLIKNDVDGDAKKETGKSFLDYKCKLLWDFTTEISNARPQFYYTKLRDNYKAVFVDKIQFDTAYKRTDWKISIDTPLRKMVFKEFYNAADTYAKILPEFDIATSNNLWLRLYHLYYKIHSVLFNNLLWLLLFFIAYFISVWQTWKSRFANKPAFIVLCIGSIHFIALFALTVFGWYQARYIEVSEFIIYLSLVFFPLLFKKNLQRN